MLPIQFLAQNAHFAISLLAALAFFAAWWLHFDAWTERRLFRDKLRWVGFLLLALSFLIHATSIESASFGSSVFGDTNELISTALRVAAYAAIIYGLRIDPLQARPETTGLSQALIPGVSIFKFALPILSVVAGFLYYRKVRIGLERQLGLVAYTFWALAASELFGLASFWRGSGEVFIFNLTAAYGPIWILEHLALLLATAILARWVWQYLTLRLLTQLFIIFTTAAVTIFLVTTVSFTYLLLRNIESSALENMSTGVNVLSYALEAKKSQARSSAEVVAQKPEIIQATAAKDHGRLVTLTLDLLEREGLSSLMIVADSGQVLLRAEDADRYGDSISADTLFKKTLLGEAASSTDTFEDVIAPVVRLRGAAPVRSGSRIVGVALAGTSIDNTFLDGIKAKTGLDSAVYAGNVRSATTLVGPDRKSRWVGVKEEDPGVSSTVLESAKPYQTTLNILNTSYLAAYAPLQEVSGTVVGMIFVGAPQATAFQTAGRSVELTFLIAAILIALSLIPAYLIARYLTYQLK